MGTLFSLITVGGVIIGLVSLAGGVSGVRDLSKQVKKSINIRGTPDPLKNDDSKRATSKGNSIFFTPTRKQTDLTNDKFRTPTQSEITRNSVAERLQARRAREVDLNRNIKFSTSLEGANIVRGKQLSRNDSNFEDTLSFEGARSKAISKALVGNTQNKNFDLGLPSSATQQDRDRVIKAREDRKNRRLAGAKTRRDSRNRLKNARNFNAEVLRIKNRDLPFKEERQLLNKLNEDFKA